MPDAYFIAKADDCLMYPGLGNVGGVILIVLVDEAGAYSHFFQAGRVAVA